MLISQTITSTCENKLKHQIVPNPTRTKQKTMSLLFKQNQQPNSDLFFFPGGLFLHSNTIPASFITCIPSNSTTVSCFSWKKVGFQILKVQGAGAVVFSSLSLSINGRSDDVDHRYKSNQVSEQENIQVHGSGAVNITKHLWSGAFAAMVSRYNNTPQFVHTIDSHINIILHSSIHFIYRTH